MDIKEYSKEDLIKLVQKLKNEKGFMIKKQQITDKISSVNEDIRANRIWSIVFGVAGFSKIPRFIDDVWLYNDKDAIMMDCVLLLFYGGATAISIYDYNKKKSDKKLLEQELNFTEDNYKMINEQFSSIEDDTNIFVDSEESNKLVKSKNNNQQ